MNFTLPAGGDCTDEVIRLQQRVVGLEREILTVRSRAVSEFLEQSPIPVWTIVGEEEEVVFANAAALRLFEASSPDQVIGREAREFFAPGSVEAASPHPFRSFEWPGGAPGSEHQMIDTEGNVIDVLTTSRAFPYNGTDAWYISFVDLTTRKTMERSLLETTERFHDLAENVREVFSIFDPKLRKFIYVSPGYEAIWQRRADALIADPKDWLKAVHPDDMARIEQAAERYETFNEEYRILRASGEVRWIRARSYPIHDSGGELLRIVGFSEDVTEWKRMEQQLLQSQKMDAVGRLAGGIAHDFNNLLTVINGYSAMIAEHPGLPSQLAPDLDSIRKAGERAALLTAQLLAFSRKQVLQPKSLNLNAAVAEVEPILRRLIRENVELKTVLTSASTCIKADPTQLEQVMLNLVINARDAIDETGTITIETGVVEFGAQEAMLHQSCSEGSYVMVAVSDTGCGMSAQTQERIFEPFFTTKNLGQGTGLGLATVYGIVKQSGGTIWVYSEEGVGTTFKVYFPLAEEAALPASEPDTSKAKNGSATVLLVEDDEQVRNIAAAVLKARGYRVLVAMNGEDALEKAALHRGQIDLLVTDVIMPKMGGSELAERLCPECPEMRVLFISGYTENAAIHKGVMTPGLHHLDKPFSPDALARKVSDVLLPRNPVALQTMTARHAE